MVADDRRRFQRLKLNKPILATMQGKNALIIDIGMTGAMVEHHGELTPGEKFSLVYRWNSADVEFTCEVARTVVVRKPGGEGESTVSHTGVRFVDTSDETLARLQDMIATFVGKVLAAQRANAAGDLSHASGPAILEQLGEARRKRTPGFITYRLRDDKWWRVPSNSPVQPAEGFTVAAWEDEEELEMLCQSYQESDEETRTMIRLVAELSAHTQERK